MRKHRYMASKHTLLYSQNFAHWYYSVVSAGLCWYQDQQMQRRYPPSTTMPCPVFDWQDQRVCSYRPHLRVIHYRCQAQILLPARWWSLFFQFQVCHTKNQIIDVVSTTEAKVLDSHYLRTNTPDDMESRDLYTSFCCWGILAHLR